MSFELDEDATIVFGVSAFILLANVLFVGTVFVYFCCCIEVASFGAGDTVHKADESRPLHRGESDHSLSLVIGKI